MILPDPDWDPFGPELLERTRASVQWIKANEPSLRGSVAAKAIDGWWRDFGEPDMDSGLLERANFADTLKLVEVTYVVDGVAYLLHHDLYPAGGHMIQLQIGSSGEIIVEPSIPW